MLFVTLVLDGVGIGAQPDAAHYGDAESHTLKHVCAVAKPPLPNLTALGLGCIEPLYGVPAVHPPNADFGRMQAVSAGKDSTTGHWELAGLHLDTPFPTYPDGFPDLLVRRFLLETQETRVLGNCAASGTEIIAQFGPEHETTGAPILYTSADSVFQIAAHKDVVPLDRLYELCYIARHKVCVGEHAVGRVIARPFEGAAGNYRRVSAERKDFTRLPTEKPLQQILQEHGVETIAIGKIGDLFGHIGFDQTIKAKSNLESMQETVMAIEAHHPSQNQFIWTNLVEFDQEFGHRNDPHGFGAALAEFDALLPELLNRLPADSHLVLTADHGTDPTTPGTDHTREYVPLLSYTPQHKGHRDLGIRTTFADHAATVADFFKIPYEGHGTTFL